MVVEVEPAPGVPADEDGPSVIGRSPAGRDHLGDRRPRSDLVDVAGRDVHLAAVGVGDLDRTGDSYAEVVCLAGVGTGDGLDAFGPTPSRLECHSGDLTVADLDHVDSGLVRRPRFVWVVEGFGGHDGS